MSRTKIVSIGACGRMGFLVADIANREEEFELVALVDAPSNECIGTRFPGISLMVLDCIPADIPTDAVGVCFVPGDALLDVLKQALSVGLPLVVGSNGMSDETREAMADAAKSIPILYAANFSLGINVLIRLAKQAAAMLKDFEVEIFEAHHSAKLDAPSGTAIAIGKAVAEARNVNFYDVAVFDRHKQDVARKRFEIGFSSMRGGDVVGEHELVFFGGAERLIIGHRAHSREVFARGALHAAQWLSSREPGKLYSMDDVLNI